LTPSNVIQDGFYDSGYAGINLKKIGPLPSLAVIQSKGVDMKRETILIDFALEQMLPMTLSLLSDIVPNMTPEQQIKAVALAVSKAMGGAIVMSELADYNFKFRISELKLAQNSNVIPIGKINQGTFYHRALLFKVMYDRLGLKPCSLVRGDYNRAWNVIDVKNQIISLKTPLKTNRSGSSARRKSQVPTSGTIGTPLVSTVEQKLLHLGCTEVEAETFSLDEPAIVDLMFHPGRLIPINSPEAEKYKRCDFQ
jgi:armadillo repeat-containing protein 3